MTTARAIMAPENALRWEVKAHIDDNVCQPCKDNDKKLYRSRSAAYKDYPNGRGYRLCVGAQYGNTCRCKVLKRGRGEKNSMDLAQLVAKAQDLTTTLSARALAESTPAPQACTECRDNAIRNAQTFRASNNALYVYDAIGGWDGTKAIDVAQALAGMTGPVDLHLNSPGGIIFEGAAMYNAIRAYTGGPVTSWIDGYAASAASFVALAASPYDSEADTGGVRMAKNAVMMIHDGMGMAMGTADDMRDVADLLDMLSDTIAGIYAERAGGTAQDWRDVMRNGDTWYNSAQALESKLVDLIVGESAPPAKDPSQPHEPMEPPMDIALFQPVAHTQTATSVQPVATLDASRVEGLRNALKGAFA